MPDAAHWPIRLAQLARRAHVPGAVLGIWADGREVLAACGVLNRATGVRYVGLRDRASSAFPPGGAYSCCNSGWVLLGRIIEVLGGRTWDQPLRERLCEPLELTQTATLLLAATGDLATLTEAQPEELVLYPADASGVDSVCRPREDEPWIPASSGLLADRTPCLFSGGRVTPRVG